jgi:hypothetical protein
MTVMRIAGLCSREITTAAELAWANLWRMARSVGIEARPDLAADLRVALREELDPHVGHLEALVRDTTARALGLDGTGGTVHENAQSMLRVAYDRAREQLSEEIDLFVLSLEAAPSTAPPGGGSATFNVYAPVGAIVTGAGASASVVQTLGTEDRRVIVLLRLPPALALAGVGLFDFEPGDRAGPSHASGAAGSRLTISRRTLMPNAGRACGSILARRESRKRSVRAAPAPGGSPTMGCASSGSGATPGMVMGSSSTRAPTAATTPTGWRTPSCGAAVLPGTESRGSLAVAVSGARAAREQGSLEKVLQANPGGSATVSAAGVRPAPLGVLRHSRRRNRPPRSPAHTRRLRARWR